MTVAKATGLTYEKRMKNSDGSGLDNQGRGENGESGESSSSGGGG